MTVAVVHTVDSACLCHVSVLDALESAGIPAREIDADSLPEGADRLRGCRIAFDQTDTYRGTGNRIVVSQALRDAGVEVVGSPVDVGRELDDKLRCRARLESAGLPVPALPTGWPRIVKAAGFHGSHGVRYVRTVEEERAALASLPGAFVEEYVPGREIAVGLFGRGRPRVLPPVEIRIAGPIYTSEEKWGPENPPVERAAVPDEIPRRLADAYVALGLRDMARFDLRVRPDGTWAVLEVNVRPSLEPVGLFGIAAAFDGIQTRDLILGLLRTAGGP